MEYTYERCKCCGQLMPPKGLPIGVKLTPMQRRLWDMVSSRPGLSAMQLLDRVYADDPAGGPSSSKTIHVVANQLNTKLREHGLEIRSSASDGYRVRFLAPAAPQGAS